MKSVWENEPKRFCFALTLWPRQGQGQWKQYEIVEVNGTYKNGRYEKISLNSLCVMSDAKVLVV